MPLADRVLIALSAFEGHLGPSCRLLPAADAAPAPPIASLTWRRSPAEGSRT